MSTASNWDHYQSTLYRTNGSLDEFELVEGLFALPVAEAPPTDPVLLAAWSPVVLVRAHAPYRRKTVHFKGRKTGSPPMLVKPASTGALAFVGGTLAYQQPQSDTSLTGLIWEGSGSYTFIENCRSDPDDGFVLTGTPWITYNQQQTLTQGADYRPVYGAVAQAGVDARAGYGASLQLNLNSSNYTYTVATYVPGLFFSSGMLNGEAVQPVGSTSEFNLTRHFRMTSPPPGPFQ